MPAEIVEITNYEFYHFAARDAGSKAVMICTVKNGVDTVYVYFHGGTSPLPETTKSGSSYFLNYRYTDMAAIIDMMRNEKPVYLIYVPEGSNNTRLSTSFEPVGEGEAH